VDNLTSSYAETEQAELLDNSEHETYQLYAEEGIECPYPSATWWAFDEKDNNRLDEAGESLDNMLSTLAVEPSLIEKTPTIFCARYEFPAYNKPLKHGEAAADNAMGFIDFPSGVPYGCIDRLAIIGEVLTDKKIGVTGEEKSVPPFTDDLFEEKDQMPLLGTLIWVQTNEKDEFLAESIGGGNELKNHWWLRHQILEDVPDSETLPVPGEFVALVVFIFPNLPWGWQQTNPFIISGNWIETPFYTSGIVKSADHDQGEYIIQYRKYSIDAVSSDWAQYEVDDRVTILKTISPTPDTFTWEELGEYKESEWVIVPVTFYQEDV
jgi:hypothetical protein